MCAPASNRTSGDVIASTGKQAAVGGLMCAAVAVLVFVGDALVVRTDAARFQPRAAQARIGINGYVVAPDGTPVSAGTVAISTGPTAVTASIDGSGRFQIVPPRAGSHVLDIIVPGFAPYRMSIHSPSAAAVALPIVRLAPATYFRAAFVTADGSPILAPRLRTLPLSRPALSSPNVSLIGAEHVDASGTITVGPLIPGTSAIAFNTLPYAQTRLPDVDVTDEGGILDAETMVIGLGTVLHVDVVDETGQPVPDHDVLIEDASLPSPLFFPRARTDQQGRATFDRLGRGRYRVRSHARLPCERNPLPVARLVTVSGTGELRARLVVGGTVGFAVSSSQGPVGNLPVTASPVVSPGTMLPVPVRVAGGTTMMMVAQDPACGGYTDAEGRVTLRNFPPGPATVTLRFANSRYVRRVSVPERPQMIPIELPAGLLQVRVMQAGSPRQPIGRAEVVWTGSGGSVEAATTASGDALLENVADVPATLAVSAPGFHTRQVKLDGSLSPQDVQLVPAPAQGFTVRAVTPGGVAIPGAVVHIDEPGVRSLPGAVIADEGGVSTFTETPAAGSRVLVGAEGFASATMTLSAADLSAGHVVVRLRQGFRVIADVSSPSATEVTYVHVFDERGRDLGDVLDWASDRVLNVRGRLTLGPLASGAYVIELRGPQGTRRQRVEIVDRDAAVMIN